MEPNIERSAKHAKRRESQIEFGGVASFGSVQLLIGVCTQLLDIGAAIGAIYGRDVYDPHLARPSVLGGVFLVDAPHFCSAGRAA
jgi:hypothetical protein